MSGQGYEFPLSFAQQRLWFLDQLEGPSTVYTVRLPVRLSGRLDRPSLQAAVDHVVSRHETLRSTIVEREGRPLQLIAETASVGVDWHGDGDIGSEDFAAIHRWVGEQSARSFDLANGSLFRVHVLRLGDDEHLLLLLTHHIVSDAWSSGVLFRDLAAAYDAIVRGRSPAIDELPVQYADFAVWQRDWLQGPELDRQLDFWRRTLAGAPASSTLPADRPRPARQTYAGQRLTRVLPATLAAGLGRLAGEQACTLFMVLFAAFNVLLYRYSGQTDLCVGTPIAGRRRTELEGLVGLFANTLVLRTDLGGQPDFTTLLVQVRQASLAAFAHQDMPFEKLVEDLQPVRDQSRSPLFQTMFILQNVPWDAQPITDLDVMPGEAGPVDTAKFDLTLSVSEFDAELWVNLEYNTDLFDADTIERLADSYAQLLSAIVENPARPVDDYALLPDERAGESRLSGPVRPLEEAPRLDAMFAAQAQRTPDAIAVEAAGERLSYRDIESRAGRLGDCLAELLPRVGSPFVAIATARTPAMPVAMLGVLRSGAAYVPLDADYPQRRLGHMLEDSGAGILVTESHLVERLPAFDGAVILLYADGRLAEIRMPVGESSEAGERHDGSLAYLIYTSGSTGRPKGVRVGHRAAVNFLRSMAEYPGLDANDRLLAVTTLSFDIALLELMLPLVSGATVCLADADMVRDGPALIRLIETAAPTVMQATPATWRMLMHAGWAGMPGLGIWCGGEPLDASLARQLLERGAELWNLYGPTETTVWSTVARLTAADLDRGISIGRPIANTTIRILDPQRRPVPPGAVGELMIGGAGLADGYHRQSALTAERFIDDPCAAGQRLYRTGDRSRLRNDGCLELFGRMDRQIKLRGYRIELGEIESALNSLDDVPAAAVVLREERLVAYVESPSATIDPAGLRRRLRDALPDHMLPAVFVSVDALPLTPNGKLDRRRLPAPDTGLIAASSSRSRAPDGAVETALASLYAELLVRGDIDAEAHFFDLGGHSLLATQLVARIRNELGVDLPLRDLFDEPTVAGLAQRLGSENVTRNARRFAGRSGRLVPRDERFRSRAPASLMQQRLWFLEQLEPNRPTYNLAWCLRLGGELDRAALSAAIGLLVERHEILRTALVDRGGEPEQRIAAALQPEVSFETARDTAVDAQYERLRGLASRPFDLATAPLFRVHVIATGEREHLLLIVIHHVIADGWSMGVLFGELAQAYNALRAGSQPVFDKLPVQYADYALWQRAHLRGARLQAQIDYWKRALDGAPPVLSLPTDRPRPAVQSHRGARVSMTLDAPLIAAVERLAREEACTSFMAYAAAFAIVLGRYAGSDDVVFGAPIAGRGRTELEGLIGFFVNTLVLRTRLEGNPTVRELFARVRGASLEAFENADVPFEKLVDECRPDRDTSRTPIFQVMLNLHSEPRAATGFDGLTATPVGVDRGMAKFDLALSLNATDDAADGMRAHFEYNADLFTAATIHEIADYFAQTLAVLAAEPGRPLNDWPTLPGMQTGHGRADRAPWSGTLESRFAEQVSAAPKQVAVRAGEQALSYGELDARANALARQLLDLGLDADAHVPRVGLIGRPAPPLVAGLLGILKAGCAWVPLDPDWPAERLAAIAADAGLAALVADPAMASRAGEWLDRAVPVLVPDDRHAAAPDADPGPDALACLIYTSGSTGEPKGVMQTRRGVLLQVQRYAESLDIAPADRLSGLAGLAYDAAIQDVFGALLTGATLCLYDVRGNGLAEDTALVTALGEDGITIVHAAPSLYRYLFGGDLNCSHDLSAVRCVVLGGEPARRSDFDLFRARFAAGTRFVNGLGLTESTLALQFHADAQTRFVGQSVPVGDAVPGLRVELIGADGQPGWSGEIVLRGDGLSPGYWRRGALTAERSEPGVLRTGDLGRRLPDGRIMHIGRRDEQLNVRGYRVESAEIEAALLAVDGIRECAIGQVERGGEGWLVAWIGGAAESLPGVERLRALLAKRLPGFMLPQIIERVDALPRLPNGKLDRRALPAPGSGRERSARPARPSHELEAELLAIWQDVLQLDDIGRHDDFFALGGHSLLATRVVARIRDRLELEVPLLHLFEHPTIAGLAAALNIPAHGPAARPSRNARVNDPARLPGPAGFPVE